MRVLALVLAITAASTQAATRPRVESVWWWFSTCGGPMMTIEVKADQGIVAKASVPLCRAPRESPRNQGGAGRIDFSFRPRRPIVWKGYRDDDDHSAPGDSVEGSLWQAGADPDALLIGVSFSTHDRILMNTIHIAHPNRRDESRIAAGLTVTTYPSDR